MVLTHKIELELPLRNGDDFTLTHYRYVPFVVAGHDMTPFTQWRDVEYRDCLFLAAPRSTVTVTTPLSSSALIAPITSSCSSYHEYFIYYYYFKKLKTNKNDIPRLPRHPGFQCHRPSLFHPVFRNLRHYCHQPWNSSASHLTDRFLLFRPRLPNHVHTALHRLMAHLSHLKHFPW